MILPSMRYDDDIRKHKQVKFGGLDRRVGAGDGDLWDMRNLTGDDYPVLSVRPPRQILRKLEKPNGLFYWKGMLWVDGTDVYFDGAYVGQVSDSRKTFGAVGEYIVILPDKVCFHTKEGTMEAMEVRWEPGEGTVSFYSGNGYISDKHGFMINVTGDTPPDLPMAEDLFRVGDAVTVFGLAGYPDGFSAVLRRVTTDSGTSASGTYYARTLLIFDDNTFAGHYISGAVQFVRKVPDFVQVCEDGNRLWGCDRDTIYACKLGDPFNWSVYEGLETDSWTVTPGATGEFTGCINFQGYPTFFKEDRVYKVYGSLPSEFQVVDTPCLGVAKGCGESLAVAADLLFYIGSGGMMAYTGGSARPVGEALGAVRLTDGRAGSDGLKYFASAKGSGGVWMLYVYDTLQGLWHLEDETEAVSLCRAEGALWCLAADGTLQVLGSSQVAVEGATQETDVPWMAEFGDFTQEDPNHKGVSKLQLRLQMEEGSRVKVMIQFDSDGVWRTVRDMVGQGGKRNYYLPILPRRCDHYRLKLEGVGPARVYSLVRETYSGSERNAR